MCSSPHESKPLESIKCESLSTPDKTIKNICRKQTRDKIIMLIAWNCMILAHCLQDQTQASFGNLKKG